MKRSIKAIAAILIALVMLAGCAAPASKGFSRGKIEIKVYTSSYSGLSFTAPEGWVYATEDELKDMMSSQLSKYGEQISDDLLKNRVIYDMVIKNPSNGSFVSVAYLNVALLAAEYGLMDGGASFTEDDLLDSVKEALGQMTGYSSVTGDISDIKLGSQNFRVLYTTGPNDGSSMCYCVRKMDKLMLYIIINTMSGDDTDDIAKYFF